MKKIKFALPMVLIILLFLSVSTMAKGISTQKDFYLAKATQDKVTKTMSNISNWGCWIFWDGISAHTPTDDSGGFYPRGTSTCIYMDGIVWGGLVDTTGDGVGDHIRVGGQTYATGTQAGWIQADGSAVDADDEDRVHIYRIRKDWESLDVGDPSVVQESKELGISAAEILTNYENDWNNWPDDLGAPVYEDGTPGIAGADQVIWLVVNDKNASLTADLYGSPPIGIELQITIWAYNQPTTTLGQLMFKKFRFINKSGKSIDSMFVAQWSDPDVGTYTDDLVGCDTKRSLGFAYSGFKTDGLYSNFNLPPAAIGYDFFQGPLLDGVAGQDLNENGVDDADDYGIFDMQVVGPGKINLPMTSFGYFAAGSAITDPDLQTYDGTKQWYNLLNGYIPTDAIDNPSAFTHGSGPLAGQETKFPVDGDPFTMTGDLDAFGTNLAPGDRRLCLCSGPFTMEDGDVQEIVVAVVGGIVAEAGGDNRNAVAQLKFNDDYAQFLYDNLFEGVPSPPPAPKVSLSTFENTALLEWGSDLEAVKATEADDPILGFNFQGYNIYQLPSAEATKSQAKLVATFDIQDNIMNIRGSKFLATVGDIVEIPIQKGSDSGIKRSFKIAKDYINDRELYNGSNYYFAVTAYNYNSDPTVPEPALESSLSPITVIPQAPLPGTELSYEINEAITTEHTVGTAGGDISAKVVDPYKVTGHSYEVYFDLQHYYLSDDGLWYTTNYADSVGKLSKTTDLTGSSLSAASVYGKTAGTVDLRYWVNVVSPDYDYCDGVKLTFPAGITINSASSEVTLPIVIDKDANTVMFGTNDTTGAGPFSGGQLISVNVNTFTPTLTTDYIMYDDGWAVGYGAPYDTYGDGIVHVTGSVDVTEIGNDFKTINHWNLYDATDEENVLVDQTIVNGVQLEGVFDGIYKAGGDAVGADAGAIADGLQLDLSVGYAAPLDYNTYTHINSAGDEDVFSHSRANAWLNYDQWGKPYEITSYMDHGWSGGNGTARSIDAYGYGTNEVDLLQRDYELRFTGEYGDKAGNYTPVLEGTGSKAIIYGARGYDLADHPDANNPGDGSAFFIQVPFEVWDMEAEGGPRQISMLIYDRMGDPTADEFYAFNPANRMYCEFLMEPYADVIAGVAGDYVTSSNLTWNTVWWNCDWTNGDVIEFLYDNPIQQGTDSWVFETIAPVTDSEELTKGVVKDINVFPNPYYAYNPESTNRFDDFVTFSHLPPKAKIHIFNLAGTEVRVLEKDDETQFIQWNLRNESDLPVASGAYIAFIDMPDIGKEKVLKLFVIQDKQIMEFY